VDDYARRVCQNLRRKKQVASTTKKRGRIGDIKCGYGAQLLRKRTQATQKLGRGQLLPVGGTFEKSIKGRKPLEEKEISGQQIPHREKRGQCKTDKRFTVPLLYSKLLRRGRGYQEENEPKGIKWKEGKGKNQPWE